ncbi:MAG TPA: Holliday junction resolvase RecU [Gallicola sp.]|nr:Holliday junction resolvase RecU [Gallicola sp.]
MKLEKIIEDKCEEYIKNEIAYIYKVPTSFTVIRKGKQIISAFPKKKSTIDFMGAYNGLAIAIETKSTNNKTSFPFSNIADHQYNFFMQWCKQAKGFYIVWFKVIDEMFLVKAVDIQKAKDTIDRKSIPLDWFKENAIKLDENIDFIKHI